MPRRTFAETKADFDSKIAPFDLTLLDDYHSINTSIRARCPRGHLIHIDPAAVIYGKRRTFRGCHICANWDILRLRSDISTLKRQNLMVKYARKHKIEYQIPKLNIHFHNRAHACQVVKCEPTQMYIQEIVEKHHLPWNIATLQHIVKGAEKYKFQTFPNRTIAKHKETMTAVILYWWCQTHGIHYAQRTISEWVGITSITLRLWLRRLTPFFNTLGETL